jgi:hypothetical protein
MANGNGHGHHKGNGHSSEAKRFSFCAESIIAP